MRLVCSVPPQNAFTCGLAGDLTHFPDSAVEAPSVETQSSSIERLPQTDKYAVVGASFYSPFIVLCLWWQLPYIL